MLLDLTNEKSTMVQEMAWCRHWQHQAISWANVDPDLCGHMASSGDNELISEWTTHTMLLSFSLAGGSSVINLGSGN